MFHVFLIWDMLTAFVQDPELNLDMKRLVHGEHDAQFLAPLRPGDTIQLNAKLEQVADKSSGLLVIGRFQCSRDGELVVNCRSSFFIRSAKAAKGANSDGSTQPNRPPRPKRTIPPGDIEESWTVDADQSYRYADASRDRNPIHLDAEFAKKVGLGDVILHGLCTMAMSGKSVTALAGNGQPDRLKRLSVRFSKPVRNQSTLTTRAWHTDRGLKFTILDSDGDPVITHGIAEIEPI